MIETLDPDEPILSIDEENYETNHSEPSENNYHENYPNEEQENYDSIDNENTENSTIYDLVDNENTENSGIMSTVHEVIKPEPIYDYRRLYQIHKQNETVAKVLKSKIKMFFKTRNFTFFNPI